MTLHETPVGDADEQNHERDVPPLELLTDDGETWTAVPIDAAGDDRLTRWLTVEVDDLCALEAWR